MTENEVVSSTCVNIKDETRNFAKILLRLGGGASVKFKSTLQKKLEIDPCLSEITFSSVDLRVRQAGGDHHHQSALNGT